MSNQSHSYQNCIAVYNQHNIAILQGQASVSALVGSLFCLLHTVNCCMSSAPQTHHKHMCSVCVVMLCYKLCKICVLIILDLFHSIVILHPYTVTLFW